MSERLRELLHASRQVERITVPSSSPEIAAKLAEVRDALGIELAREIPQHLLLLEKQHGWAATFNRRMELCADSLLAGADPEDALISKAELRRSAPSFGHVLDALRDHPDVLGKAEQGFVRPLPVPIGLSPDAFAEPLARALRQHADAGMLRATDGSPQPLNCQQQVCILDCFTDSRRIGSSRPVYFPQRFGRDHGGKTKPALLAESRFPGWQVLLLEDLRDIPWPGGGRVIGGRKQLEAGRSPREYLKLLATETHVHEQGLTPEAWLTLQLAHLTETQGEVLDDHDSGSACHLTGVYVLSRGVVPWGFWSPVVGQAAISGRAPGQRYAVSGMRAAVPVL